MSESPRGTTTYANNSGLFRLLVKNANGVASCAKDLGLFKIFLIS